MPPAAFEIIAPVMMALRDDIASLKAEVSEQRTATQRDIRSMEHVETKKQGVDDIKKFIHEVRNHELNNSYTFARIVAGPVLNRSFESRRIPERITQGVQPNNGRSRHHLTHGHNNRPSNVIGSAQQVSNDPKLALNARPENEPTPPSVPEPTPQSVPETTPPSIPDRPTFALRPGQTADCPSTLRTGHDDEIDRLRPVVDTAVAVFFFFFFF